MFNLPVRSKGWLGLRQMHYASDHSRTVGFSLSGAGLVALVLGYISFLNNEGGMDFSPSYFRWSSLFHFTRCYFLLSFLLSIFLYSNLFFLIARLLILSRFCHALGPGPVHSSRSSLPSLSPFWVSDMIISSFFSHNGYTK